MKFVVCFVGWSLYAVSLVATVSCLYSSSDDVVELTANNFDREVKNYDGVVLVEFYAPWCVLCQKYFNKSFSMSVCAMIS